MYMVIVITLAYIIMFIVHNYCVYVYTTGCLSVFTTINGGIIDDCIVTRTGQDSFYIVANAGRADVDLNHIRVSQYYMYMWYM